MQMFIARCSAEGPTTSWNLDANWSWSWSWSCELKLKLSGCWLSTAAATCRMPHAACPLANSRATGNCCRHHHRHRYRHRLWHIQVAILVKTTNQSANVPSVNHCAAAAAWRRSHDTNQWIALGLGLAFAFAFVFAFTLNCIHFGGDHGKCHLVFWPVWMSVGQFGLGSRSFILTLAYECIHLPLTNWLSWQAAGTAGQTESQTDRGTDGSHLLLAFPKLTIFGAFRWPHNNSSKCCCCYCCWCCCNCNMPHISQQDKFLYNCICCSLQSRPATSATERERETMLHYFYFYINCMPLATVHSTPPFASSSRYPHPSAHSSCLLPDWAGPQLAAIESRVSKLDSNCHLMRHARHLRTTHDYQFAQAKRLATHR